MFCVFPERYSLPEKESVWEYLFAQQQQAIRSVVCNVIQFQCRDAGNYIAYTMKWLTQHLGQGLMFFFSQKVISDVKEVNANARTQMQRKLIS